MEESGGLSLYGFVLNDPLNFFDPLGHEPQAPTLEPSGQGSQWRDPATGKFVTAPNLPPPPPGSSLVPKQPGVIPGPASSPSSAGFSASVAMLNYLEKKPWNLVGRRFSKKPKKFAERARHQAKAHAKCAVWLGCIQCLVAFLRGRLILACFSSKVRI
jgi:hypothetical protein